MKNKILLKPKKNLNEYVKYSTIGIQMVAFVVISVFLGRWIDGLINVKFPVFTLIFVLFGLVVAMYYMYKKLL